ncbi:MAG: SRPBCC family protein [Candidatus Schekmanbacteria bacterium]|nr:SRPBCC family protein [Candidatus Schekmanbacteria bacterium]
MKEVSQTLRYRALPHEVYQVVADFDRYPEFMSDHQAAQIIARSDRIVEVRFTIVIVKAFDFEVVHTMDPGRSIDWVHRKGPFKHCEGGWHFAPSADGLETDVRYRIAVDPGFFIPGFIVKSLIEGTLPRTLNTFKGRVEALCGR